MSLTFQSGVEVEIDVPLPTVSAPPDVVTVVDAPSAAVALTAPSSAPAITPVPATEGVVVPVSGPAGPGGPLGPPGPPGPTGNLDEDLPDLTLLFENGLI